MNSSFNTPLSDKFEQQLTPEKKNVIAKYFVLSQCYGDSREDLIKYLTEILNISEKDKEVSDWIKFVDCFFSNVEDYELPDSGARAYLSEYLPEKLGFQQPGDVSTNPSL